MEWVVLALLAVAVVAATVLVMAGRVEPPTMSEATSTAPPLELPEEPTSADIDDVRLGTALHGYVPSEVDSALDARRDRLAAQEAALAERDDVRPDA